MFKQIIVSLLKKLRNNSSFEQKGYVLSVKDGIAEVFGLKQVASGEMVFFNQANIFGMALNLESQKVGIFSKLKQIISIFVNTISYVFPNKWLNVESKKWFFLMPELGLQENNLVSYWVNFCLLIMVTLIFIELIIAVLKEFGIHDFKSYEISLILFTALGIFYAVLVLLGTLHKCSISVFLFYIFSFRNKEELKDLEILKTGMNTAFFSTFCATFYVESVIISASFVMVSITIYLLIKKQEHENVQSALWVLISLNILFAFLGEFDLLLLALVYRWIFFVLKLNYVSVSDLEKVNNVLFLKVSPLAKGPDQWVTGNVKHIWRISSKILESNPAASFWIAMSAGLFGSHQLHKTVIVKDCELTAQRELVYRNSRVADLSLTLKQRESLIEESIGRERTAMAKASEPVSFVEFAIKKASEVWTA
jgi:hypothetical protein